jgi:hypothetical protein
MPTPPENTEAASKAFAQRQLQPFRDIITDRHRKTPYALDPLAPAEWELLGDIIAFAYAQGNVDGTTASIDRTADLLENIVGGGVE